MNHKIFLFSGIPASGKSSFCRFLCREHSFVHYDLECWPRGWPHPEFKEIWDRSRVEFVNKLMSTHSRVALDWGFPINCISWVKELEMAGVQLIWFDADTTKARESFIARGGISISDFDDQVGKILAAKLPDCLTTKIINTLSTSGFKAQPELYTEIFGKNG